MDAPKTTTYLTSLSQAGLTYSQAVVYEILLKNGPLKAGKIHQKTTLKRGLVYKMLDELVDLGLVKKNQTLGKVDVFEPEHPTKLKDLAEKAEDKAKTAQTVLDGFMSKMVSDFNLVSSLPGVQIYEGVEGAKKVLDDSLQADTEIYSYIDSEAVNKLYPDMNKQYVSQRNKEGLKKKMITLDSPYIREHAKSFNRATTAVRLITAQTPFTTVMQIYDTKVSYISLQGKSIISSIIDNPHIAQMHKTLFEVMWQTAKPLALPAAPAAPSSAASV